ncbi:MAG: glucose-6-phosphate dehydrogenase (NADP(+)) [Candidatus Peribacteraceae bacterium]|nr:glucose-6-phosphate dehydrogenase (NADP(+)) [Candidatus Peribacteraceae bacterium]
MLSSPSPFTFILFGASGHLAQNKIYPALYTLALKKRLPDDYSIVGFSRSKMNGNEFKKLVEDAIKKDMLEVNEDVLNNFLEHIHYHQGAYDDVKSFEGLNSKINEVEKNSDGTVRLAYLSVPPSVFHPILQNLCKAGIHHKKGMFRCIVEKPVGDNAESAEIICKEIRSCFEDEEIFFLDHFLGKEAVRNAYYLRRANPLLERLFKNTLIKSVEITAFEQAGLEGRTGYFEHTGTFRDMFQSHLLMIASLLTMRLSETDSTFRSVRLNALEQFYLPPASNLSDILIQAQYGDGVINGEKVLGYAKEKDVDNASRTNTYIALKLMTRISRWQGVPFYLRSGKRLNKKETRISIEFQEPNPVGKGATPNRLDIILQGEAGMRMHLQTKLGGTEPEFRPLIMEDPLVCIGDCLPEHGLLLLEAILGKQQWFLSFDEVHTAWMLTDPLQTYLDDASTPLYTYASGSNGPDEADEWIKGLGGRWY